MNLHERQQFDFLLQTATERYVARLEERFRGPETALARIQQDPHGDGVWLDQFTHAVFEDFLLNNIAGACFVLQSLPRRRWIQVESGDVEQVLVAAALALFSELLLKKTIERLEQHSRYQSI